VRRMRKWLRYSLAAMSVVAFAIAVLVGWLVALQLGVWPLAPSKPAGWLAAPTSASILGCYDVSVGTWSPRLDIGADDVFMMPPRTVELTSLPGRWQGFVARPINGDSKWLPFAYWEVTPERTVTLTWSNGFSGVTAELGPKDLTLVGRAHSFWDFPRITQWSTVTATRVSCPSPR
jgi:hypothetical protein